MSELREIGQVVKIEELGMSCLARIEGVGVLRLSAMHQAMFALRGDLSVLGGKILSPLSGPVLFEKIQHHEAEMDAARRRLADRGIGHEMPKVGERVMVEQQVSHMFRATPRPQPEGMCLVVARAGEDIEAGDLIRIDYHGGEPRAMRFEPQGGSVDEINYLPAPAPSELMSAADVYKRLAQSLGTCNSPRQLAEANLEQVFLSRKDQRLPEEQYGKRLWEHLFEPNEPVTEAPELKLFPAQQAAMLNAGVDPDEVERLFNAGQRHGKTATVNELVRERLQGMIDRGQTVPVDALYRAFADSGMLGRSLKHHMDAVKGLANFLGGLKEKGAIYPAVYSDPETREVSVEVEPTVGSIRLSAVITRDGADFAEVGKQLHDDIIAQTGLDLDKLAEETTRDVAQARVFGALYGRQGANLDSRYAAGYSEGFSDNLQALSPEEHARRHGGRRPTYAEHEQARAGNVVPPPATDVVVVRNYAPPGQLSVNRLLPEGTQHLATSDGEVAVRTQHRPDEAQQLVSFVDRLVEDVEAVEGEAGYNLQVKLDCGRRLLLDNAEGQYTRWRIEGTVLWLTCKIGA